MKNQNTKILSAILCIIMVSLMIFTGCQKEEPLNQPSNEASSSEETSDVSVSDSEAAEASDSQLSSETASSKDGETVSFTLSVVDFEGNEKTFNVETTEETVGAALLKEGLIEGEDGPYGLYVKVVDNIRADFDVDGTYWAFYIDGKYATTGVDSTKVKDGETYMFKIEK